MSERRDPIRYALPVVSCLKHGNAHIGDGVVERLKHLPCPTCMLLDRWPGFDLSDLEGSRSTVPIRIGAETWEIISLPVEGPNDAEDLLWLTRD